MQRDVNSYVCLILSARLGSQIRYSREKGSRAVSTQPKFANQHILNMSGLLQSSLSVALLDEVRNALAYHEDGYVDVGADAFGHNGCVHDSQAIRSIDLAVLIHDCHGV